MLSLKTALTAITTLAALTTPALASPVNAVPSHAGKLTHTGYKILIEPEVVQAKRTQRQLTTKRITWKLRAVYVDGRGGELLVRPTTKRRPIKDVTMTLNRAWRPSDTTVSTRTIKKLKIARKRFSKLVSQARRNPQRPRLSQLLRVKVPKATKRPKTSKGKKRPMPTLVVGPAFPGPKVVIRPKAQPKPERFESVGILAERAATPPMRSCEEALLDEGHHPMHLERCAKVEPVCAVTLLESGYHPHHLDACAPALSQACTTTLLAHGHHPHHLDACEGVNEACAIDLLERGQHPNMLDYCG